jgi:hypothetical protein
MRHYACLNLEAEKKEGCGSSRTLHMRLFLFLGSHLSFQEGREWNRFSHDPPSAILRVLPQILRIHDENLDLDCKAFV